MKRIFEKSVRLGVAVLGMGLLLTGCSNLHSQAVHPEPDESGSERAQVTDNRLSGTRWQVISVAGQTVPESITSTVQFGENGRLFGMAGCNQFSGAYRLEHGRLQVERLITTRKLCFPAIMVQEESLFRVLRRAQRIQWTPDELILESARERGRSRMIALPPAVAHG